jgi:His-Xaa-Ser system protein HxsD
MSFVQLSWIENLTDNELTISVNTSVYTTHALFRVCYLFTDTCYIFLSHDLDSSVIKVRFTGKSSDTNLTAIAGEFSNELINQEVRLNVANETKQIRELIVAQAFAEADLLERRHFSSSYLDNPKGISDERSS